MSFEIIEKLEYGKLATFIPNKNLPIYNWFYFKEGFSRDLAVELFRMFNLRKGSWVMDPFCGSGTTLLAGKEKGINSIGFDVLPISVFVSIVKTRDYNIEKLERISKEILKIKFVKQKFSISKNVKKYFSPYTLEDIIFFKRLILSLENPERDFFLLALINASMKCSYAFKDGGFVKVRAKNVPPLRQMFRRQIKKMIKDLKEFEVQKCKVIVEERDARTIDVEDSVDAIITSPPYLNKIEYQNVYKIEHELFFGRKSSTTIRSFIGTIKEKDEEFGHIDKIVKEEQAKRYFKDMYIVIENLYRALKKGGWVGMVVGNGCFPSSVIESDIILSKIAEEIGFTVKKVIVLNKRFCTTPSRRKIGTARESLLIWVKE